MGKNLFIGIIAILSVSMIPLGFADPLISIGYDHSFKSSYNAMGYAYSNGGHVGTTYVVTNTVGDPYFMSLDQLTFIEGIGFEIASHSVDHLKIYDDTEQEVIDNEVINSKAILTDLGFTIHGYVPPYAKLNQAILDTVEENYEYVLMPNEVNSTIPVVRSYALGKTSTFDDVKQIVDFTINNNEHSVINIHEIVKVPVKNTDVSIELFKQLVDYLNEKGLQSTTHYGLVE